MKLPRDINGEKLAELLKRYGYETTRQTGSHMRLTTKLKGGTSYNNTPTWFLESRNFK